MTITVPRPRLTWRERLYLPAIAAGLGITLKHFKNMLLGRTKVTMQYPEQKWDSQLPDHYRGAPARVRIPDGRCAAWRANFANSFVRRARSKLFPTRFLR